MAWITLINKSNQTADRYRSMDLVDWHSDSVPIGNYTKARFHTRIISGFTKEEFQELLKDIAPLTKDIFKRTIDGKYYWTWEKGFDHTIQPVWKPNENTIKWLKIKSKPYKIELNFSTLTDDWTDLEEKIMTQQERITLLKNKCVQNLALDISNLLEPIDTII